MPHPAAGAPGVHDAAATTAGAMPMTAGSNFAKAASAGQGGSANLPSSMARGRQGAHVQGQQQSTAQRAGFALTGEGEEPEYSEVVVEEWSVKAGKGRGGQQDWSQRTGGGCTNG
jgi:hypothetical protein